MRAHRGGGRASRRRGAALVLVMIFGVAALMMITTSLALTHQSTKAQGEVERQKNLHAVLKAGIAAAINEVNRNEYQKAFGLGTYDPQGDGAGVPERVRVDGPQPLVQDVTGAHHSSDLRIRRPRTGPRGSGGR